MNDHADLGLDEGAGTVTLTVIGRVDEVSAARGITGFGRHLGRKVQPARVDVSCGADCLGTAFALLPHLEAGEGPAGPDSGFRVRPSQLDAPLVFSLAARDASRPVRVTIAGESLPCPHPVTIGEIAAWLAGEEPNGADHDLADDGLADHALAAHDLADHDLADEYRLVRLSGLFDDAFYLERYPDVAGAGMDALLHYLVAGEREGRWASYYFEPAFYAGLLGREPAGSSLLSDYIRSGAESRAATSLHFDGSWYADAYDLAPGLLPLADFLENRRARSPNRFFDVVAYLGRYPDLHGLLDPYMHFAEWGVREGRQASANFHAKYYYQRYLDGDTNQNAFHHYLSLGRFQGHLPAPAAAEPSMPAEIRANSQPGPFFEAEPVSALKGAADIKTFAFYLPQFHPIPENDAFWGKGFTEWRNLSRGQPRFAGHYQPRTPRDLGFYDLLQPDTIRDQVRLAQDAGVFGFCYYFYWFNGRRVLEKPLDIFVSDDTLSMPFCLMWANENWTRRWDGQENDVLLRQDYDPAQDEALFDCFADYFSSPRYYRIEGRPLLVLYRPGIIPNSTEFFDRLRAGIAARIGVEPLIFMTQAFGDEDPRVFGLDGAIEFPPHKVTAKARDVAKGQHFLDWSFTGQVFDYDEVAALSLVDVPRDFPLAKTVLPMWDNDARKQGNGLCIHGSTPAKFEKWFSATCDIARQHRIGGDALVFVNAWNEWCEGTYLEPDLHYGWAYLNSIARALSAEQPAVDDGRHRILLVGHDAFPAGAQYLLLNIGRQLADFGFDIRFYLLAGGDLLDAYRAVGPVVLRAEEETGAFIARTRAAGFSHALTNTSASGDMVPWLKGNGFTVASLVHELPALIHSYGLEGSCRAIAEGSDRVIFASSFVADQFYGLTGTGSERALLREQGLYGATGTVAEGDDLRGELGLPAGSRLVLGVGYGDLRKGVDIFATFAR